VKLVILCLVILIASVGLGLLALEDPGYVVLFRDPYEIRMPLLVLVLILFMAFIVLYLFLNLFMNIIRAPKKVGKLKRKMDEDAAHKACMQGFTGLIEGHWDQAEGRLLKKVESSRMPLIHYLGAAYAALQQGSLRRRDMYLDQALESQPEHRLSIQLTRARFHCHAGEYVKARQVLETQKVQNPRNKPLLRLLADVYQALGDWQALKGILPIMRKLKVLPPDEVEKCEQLTWSRLLTTGGTDSDVSEMPVNWTSMPARQKRNPAILSAWIRHLIQQGESKEAETLLRRALNRQYDAKLVDLYGQVQSPFIPYQIEFIQKLLKTRPDNAELMLALARLYRYEENLKTSISWYEKVMEPDASNEVFFELASAYEQMGDSEAALDLYKKSLTALENRSESIGKPTLDTERLLPHDSKSEIQPVQGAMPVIR